MLPREFYNQNVCDVAVGLLGKRLVHRTFEGTTSGIIVETEAYNGACDRGAHSYPNRLTERTRVQFGEGGYAYVYLIYGMHCCFNIVANLPGRPEAVLIRALEPCEGVDIMRRRRNCNDVLNLCSGPGKLTAALGITCEDYGADLCGGKLYVEEYMDPGPEEICVSPRINIDYAGESSELPWRYFIRGNRFVSKVKARYRSARTLNELNRL